MTKRCKQNKRRVLGVFVIAGEHNVMAYGARPCTCSTRRCNELILDVCCSLCGEMDEIHGYSAEDVADAVKIWPEKFVPDFKQENGGSK